MRFVAAALFLACFAGEARADEAPATERLKGFRYVLKTGLTYQKPTEVMPPAYEKYPGVTQDVSLTVSNHFGWGFPLGPIVLSPGVSVPVYFFDAGNSSMVGFTDKTLSRLTDPGAVHLPGATLAVLGEVEVHLPLRYVSLYGVVGAGAAFFFGSNTQGGVFRGGGGIMVYPASWIGIGVQATFLGMSNAARGPNDGLQALEMTWPLELRF